MSSQKILLSADTPCDIGSELKERYHVSLFPLHITYHIKQQIFNKTGIINEITSNSPPLQNISWFATFYRIYGMVKGPNGKTAMRGSGPYFPIIFDKVSSTSLIGVNLAFSTVALSRVE